MRGAGPYDGSVRRLLVLALAFGFAMSGGPTGAAAPAYPWRFEPSTTTAVLGDEVVFSLYNDGTRSVTMGNVWDVHSLDDGGSAQYYWPQEQLEVDPGEVVAWKWDQRVGSCYGICQNIRAGDPAPAGRYEVTTTIDGDEVALRFNIGQFFTLGFREREAEFSLFVSTQPQIDEMSAEAAAEEKTLIVSGIVRRKKPFNPPWHYAMGQRSIELGEVFVEVCDAAPEYVEANRREWRGQRWCPWSSYVDRVGL